jgi:hypothetical protein
MSGRAGQSLLGRFWKHELRPKSNSFFPNLILALYASKSDETWTKKVTSTHGTSSQHRFFPNPNIFLPILDELEELGFRKIR